MEAHSSSLTHCIMKSTVSFSWFKIDPDNKVHGGNMLPIWGRKDPGGPHVGPWTLLSGKILSYQCKKESGDKMVIDHLNSTMGMLYCQESIFLLNQPLCLYRHRRACITTMRWCHCKSFIEWKCSLIWKLCFHFLNFRNSNKLLR